MAVLWKGYSYYIPAYWGVASWNIYLDGEACPAPSIISLLASGLRFGC